MRVFRWLLLSSAVWAQLIDLSKNRVDPVTFIFDDGRTTLADYVLSQIRQHTTCCGEDNVYVELRINPEGVVENVRAMTGRNDCYKQSLRDILLPVRWKAENFRTTRPLYYEFSFREECKGTAQDNVYKPISAPAGAPAPVAQAGTPSTSPSETPAQAKPEPKPEAPKPPAEEPSKPPAPEKTVPPAPEKPKSVPLTPSLPGTQPPQEGEPAEAKSAEP
ncbi:MAG: hypothetical protein D6750_05230, partial [Bacteroidetes bacterium]